MHVQAISSNFTPTVYHLSAKKLILRVNCDFETLGPTSFMSLTFLNSELPHTRIGALSLKLDDSFKPSEDLRTEHEQDLSFMFATTSTQIMKFSKKENEWSE